MIDKNNNILDNFTGSLYKYDQCITKVLLLETEINFIS